MFSGKPAFKTEIVNNKAFNKLDLSVIIKVEDAAAACAARTELILKATLNEFHS